MRTKRGILPGRCDTARRSGRRAALAGRAAAGWRCVALISLLAAFSLVLARPAAAAGQPAKLTADEVTVDYEAQKLVATGQARLVYKALTITADRIVVDLIANTLAATGGVVLRDDQQTISAEELAYDLNNGEGRLGSFDGKFTDSAIKGEILFSGSEMTQSEEKISGTGLALTTCDRREPHYHFTAARIDYYPHDRLILRKVFYWEGHLRLLYLPYLAISLKERQNSFSFPRFGYSAEEGLFLKLTYNFFVGDDQSGTILLDLMQRKGIGEGLGYAWEYPSGTELSALVYHLDNELTAGDDYKAEFGAVIPLERLKLEGKFGAQDQAQTVGRLRTYQAGLRLTPSQGTGPQATLNYNASSSPSVDNKTFDAGASGRWTLWPGALLTLSGRWYRQDYESTGYFSDTDKENYNLGFSQRWKWGTFTAIASSLTNTTATTYTETSTVDRLLPELKLDIPRWEPWPGLGTLRLTLDYQNKIKESTTLTGQGQRLAADAILDSRNLAAFGPFTLRAGVSARERLYDTGEEVWSVAPGLALLAKLSPSLDLRGDYSWVITDGTPPPLFYSLDYLTPRANLGLSANYRHEAWRASLATKYAFSSRLWDPVSLGLYWTSTDGDQLSFTTSYKPQEQVFGLTTLALGWRPRKDWSFKLNASYDPGFGQWYQLDFLSTLKQPLGRNLILNLNTRYDFFREDWLQSQVSLDYVWHCRTISLGYDWTRAEISLTILVNAFPEHPLKLFYAEGGLYYTPPFILP